MMRKLLILRIGRTEKNSKNAEPRYTAGTRSNLREFRLSEMASLALRLPARLYNDGIAVPRKLYHLSGAARKETDFIRKTP